MLAYNRWSTADIKIDDPGLAKQIVLEPKLAPRSFGRFAGRRFHKSRVFVIERLANKLYVPGHRSKKHIRSSGHCTGMAAQNYKAVVSALELIEKQTKQNPIAVFVKAIENAAPREEIVAIEYGGARYPKAVDCAPQRRVDIALRNFVHGAFERSFKKKATLAEALAGEILAASRLDNKSFALTKKLELERQADASR